MDGASTTERIRIFGSTFAGLMKSAMIGPRYKSQMVVWNHADEQSASISTNTPTVQQYTERILLLLAALADNVSVSTENVRDACIQAWIGFERDVHIIPPELMNLPHDKVLKVINLLYGIPVFRLQWYLTYLNYQVERLVIIRCRTDPCILYKRAENALTKTIILEVDDSLVVGTRAFLEIEDREFKKILSKSILPSITSMSFTKLSYKYWEEVLSLKPMLIAARSSTSSQRIATQRREHSK